MSDNESGFPYSAIELQHAIIKELQSKVDHLKRELRAANEEIAKLKDLNERYAEQARQRR